MILQQIYKYQALIQTTQNLALKLLIVQDYHFQIEIQISILLRLALVSMIQIFLKLLYYLKQQSALLPLGYWEKVFHLIKLL